MFQERNTTNKGRNLIARLEFDTMNNPTPKKPTKRQMYEGLLAMPGLTEEQKKFILHELELLAKKNSGEKKPTAAQQANEVLKSAIVEGITAIGKSITVSEMIKEIPACAGLSNPKVSAMVSQLTVDKVLVRTEVKRRAYFGLPEWVDKVEDGEGE
jgi:hypothetical protein